MKLTKSISVVAVAYAVLFFGMWGFLELKNENNSRVALTLYSDYEFEQALLQKEIADNLHIVQLDDDTIKRYPVLYELIKQNQAKEKPINAKGRATATYEQVKTEIGYYASKFIEKYGEGAIPSDIYRELKKDNGWHSITLKEPFFHHSGIRYMIDPPIIVISEGEPEIRIQTVRTDYLKESLTVDLTDKDIQNMPRFREAFEQIGTYEKNVQSRIEMDELEFKRYEQWAIDAGLADKRTVFDYAYIEYDNQYYRLYLRA